MGGLFLKEKLNNVLTIRVTEEFKKQLEEQAAYESRTLSNLVQKVLSDYIDEINKAKKLLNK